MRGLTIFATLAALAITAGCAPGPLRTLERPGDGPDEFSIVPGKELQTPASLTELPEPTPGGSNRTDQFPLRDSVAALGGTRRDDVTAIPAGDGAIVNYSSRLGTNNGIREQLATEDADYRRRRGRFSQIRIFRVDRYEDVYEPQTLNPGREARRWRRSGIRTPSAPPPN